jgi:putative nucleotidyltransferase with HDIG domain
MEESRAQIADAYDATLRGWSRALDMRDADTSGHTERVAEMAVRLAGTAGVPEHDLVHVRRGALLHDIGKMSVPDAILRKPGPLSEEEWVVMRQHPECAREMLVEIDYLGPALDIPYSHHERWDGSGYPQGLKGTDIPLSARIFAVIDVYDALTSDRPYRDAWTYEDAVAHIREQAGKHFDPQVVMAFLRDIATESQ